MTSLVLLRQSSSSSARSLAIGLVLYVDVLLLPDGANRVEGIVIGLRVVDLGADRLDVVALQIACMRHAFDVGGNVEAEQVEESGQQIDTAEQFAIDLGLGVGVPRGPHNQCDSGACVIQRRLGTWQRGSVVGHEDYPGRFVQSR